MPTKLTLLHTSRMIAPLSSMTGFVHTEGHHTGLGWTWKFRSLNCRGLDGLEPGRREVTGKITRQGTITASATRCADEAPRTSPNPAALNQMLAFDLAARIFGPPPPPPPPPPTAEGLLPLPAVLRANDASDNASLTSTHGELLAAGCLAALDRLVQNRQAEGGRPATILTALLYEIAAFRADATAQAAGRVAGQQAGLWESLAALPPGSAVGVLEERLAQEVALLATRANVRGELERLGSHIAAAGALLAAGAAVKRRFDVLVRKFGRKTHPLCAKSSCGALATTRLRLKPSSSSLASQCRMWSSGRV